MVSVQFAPVAGMKLITSIAPYKIGMTILTGLNLASMTSLGLPPSMFSTRFHWQRNWPKFATSTMRNKMIIKWGMRKSNTGIMIITSMYSPKMRPSLEAKLPPFLWLYPSYAFVRKYRK